MGYIRKTPKHGERLLTFREAWELGSAQREAAMLVKWVAAGGMSVEEVRELIRIPQNIREVWEKAKDPLLRFRLLRCVRFREQVMAQFNKQLRMGRRVYVYDKESEKVVEKGREERTPSPAIQFKGTGWYVTDYKQQAEARDGKS